MKLKDILLEGIEDRHAALIDEFEMLSLKHKTHPEYPSIKEQFDRGLADFSEGYENDDDDVLDNGLEGMEQAVEALRGLNR